MHFVVSVPLKRLSKYLSMASPVWRSTELHNDPWPLPGKEPLPDSPGHAEEVSHPISPVSSISSGGHQGHDETRIEDIISFGPVRTIQVRRNSARLGKAQLINVGNATDPPKSPTAATILNPKPENDASWGIETRRLRPWHRRLGKWAIVIVILGTLLILGAFAFLIFLWVAGEGNGVWKSIVGNNWISRSITLTALTIRASICFQAALITAMIASVQLERYDTPWSRSAALSISRASGRQPYALLAHRPFSRKSWPLIIATVILALTTLGLQFSSTILLSDVALASVASRRTTAISSPYGLSTLQLAQIENKEPDYSRVTPSTFPTFAEYSETVEVQKDVDDTGTSVRALLPISDSATRESTASYAGWGTLMNSRTLCMSPTAVNVMFVSNGASTSPATPMQHVSGTISMGGILPRGLNSTTTNETIISAAQDRNISFSCSFQLSQSDLEWPISMCSVSSEDVGLNILSPFADGIMSDTSTYVLLNHSLNASVPISAVVGSGTPGNSSLGYQDVIISNWTSSSADPWLDLTYPGNPIFSIQLSLCFTSFGALDSKIEASSTSNRSEPVPSATSGGDVFSLDVSNVLVQLGVTNEIQSKTKRGILDLKQQKPFGAANGATSALDRTFGFSQPNTTYGLCTFCGTYDSKGQAGSALGIDYTLSVLFQRALQMSNSPARALKAMFTTANQMQYYSR